MSIAKNFKPLFDRVLIQKIVEAPKSTSGLILSSSSTSAQNKGRVISVGDGYRNESGSTTPLALKEGDVVLLPEVGGSHLKFVDMETTLYRYDEILGVIPQV